MILFSAVADGRALRSQEQNSQQLRSLDAGGRRREASGPAGAAEVERLHELLQQKEATLAAEVSRRVNQR